MHAYTRNIVEYSNGYFNYSKGEIEKLLKKLVPDGYYGEDYWELLRTDVEKMLHNVRKNCNYTATIGDAFDIDTELDYTVEEFCKIFEELLSETSDSSQFTYPDYLTLTWF